MLPIAALVSALLWCSSCTFDQVPTNAQEAPCSGLDTALARLLQPVERVFGIVRSILRDPARSEEVTQEVMLELWRTAPRYERRLGAATSWALTIAHRRAVDRVRSEQASRNRDERHALEHAGATAPDTGAVVVDLLDRERVANALGELTEPQRESIELAYFGGHSHSEVAALLDLPLGTVKTRIRDGLVRLRDRLEVTS